VATGILWSVIIGLWAAYLVPLWIARHDTSQPGVDAGLDDADHVDDNGRGQTQPDSAPQRRRRTRVARLLARRRGGLVARRRRRLLGLVITLVVTLVAVPLGPMPGWAAAAGALVLGGYVVHLRHQARRAQFSLVEHGSKQRRATRRRVHSGSAEPAAAKPDSPPSRPASTEQSTERRKGQGGKPRPAGAAGQPEDAQDSADEDDSRTPAKTSLWQPLPVPLPTYVTKPRAIHPARAVELSRAAAWSSARFGSGVAIRWHAAPTGPALSVGADVPGSVGADVPASTSAVSPPTCEVHPAATAATAALGHEREIQRAVGS
jgi:hypothetical protein